MPLLTVRCCLAALLACMLTANTAGMAGERWRVAVPEAASEQPTGGVVAALPDGGFVFSQEPYGIDLRWLSRFDADGTLVEGPIRWNRLLGATVVRVDGSLADYASFDDSFNGNYPALGCEFVGHLFGRVLTRHVPSYQLYSNNRYQLPPLPTRDLVEFSLPGANVERHLAIMDPYCSRRTLVRVPRDTGRTTLAEDGESVIVIDRDAAQLRRLDAGGERWALNVGGSSLRLYGKADDGDLLLATSEGPLRVSQAGALRWQRPLSEFNLPIMHMADEGFGTYVVESVIAQPTNRPYRQRISVLNERGEIVARQEATAQQMLISALPSLARPQLWLAEAATPAGSDVPARRPSTLVTLNAQAGFTPIASFSDDQRPKLELASRRIVEFDYSARIDYLRDPVTGQRQPLHPPAVPQPREVLEMIALADGALVVARAGSRKLDVVRVTATGELLWSRPLGGSDADPVLSPGNTVVVVAANATRACVWRTGIAQPLFQCLNLSNGEDEVPSFHFPLYLRGKLPQLRLDDEGALQVVGLECEPSGQSTGNICASQTLIRARLAADGAVLAKESLLGGEAQWLWSEDGQLAHPEVDAVTGDAFAIVRNDAGSVIARYHIDNREDLLAQAPGGRLLTAQRAAESTLILRQRAPDGRVEWSQTLAVEGSFSRSSEAARWLADGDWLLVRQLSIGAIEQPVAVERRSGDDGKRLWQTRLAGNRLSGPANSRPEEVVLDAANNRLWLGAPVRPGGRVIALDLTSGKPNQAALLASNPAAAGPLISGARSVLSGDGVIVAWTRESDQALQIANIAPDPVTAEAPHASAGIWHAADTEGQGLLLERFDAGNTLGGAWFTFSRVGGSADSELRWFVVQGQRDADNGYTLSVFSSTGGAFAAPPAVDAIAVGEARFITRDCQQATFTYRFTDGELAGLSGAVPLQRTAMEASACPETATSANASRTLSGSYFDPQTDGQGLLLREVDGGGGGALAGAWFTFDPQGMADDPTAQHWFTALGPAPTASSGGSVLNLYRTFGAAFDVGRTENSQPVGTLHISANACGIDIRWRFDDSLAAGAFAATEGARSLQRLGGCTTP